MTSREIQIYQCNSGEYLSKIAFHNNITECVSGDDESSLTCFVNDKVVKDSYWKTSCLKLNCTCPDLYYQNPHGGCAPFNIKCSGDTTSCHIKFIDENRQYPNTRVNHVHTTDIILQTINVEYQGKRYSGTYSINLYTDCAKEELVDI